jgi:hypothetical protein
MRFALCLALLSILLSGCGVEKKPEKKVQEQPVSDAIPENLGDPNAPTEIRALQGAKQDRDKINAQHQEASKVLKESD